MPGIVRLPLEDSTALVVPVPARRPVSLIAVPRASDAPPYAILQHVATVAALELERLTAAREEQRRLGSETLAGLLDARLSPHLALPHLPAHGLGAEPMVMLVAQATGEHDSQLHHVLAERQIAHMMLRREPLLYFLTPARNEIVDEVADAIGGDDVRVGVSDAFSDLGMFANAVREARWALEVAGSEQQRICRYGEQFGTLGPRSLAEARMIVDRVLGPVLEYDEHRGSELVQSLSVFLRCNRSWQQAADELFVHKQTLIYRMRRVEDLTGRRLGDTGTIAELWMAISALELLS
jgi:purine catabolism regulator